MKSNILLVPLVQGQEISTDNTCKSTAALGEFKSAALNELNAYKSALEFDLQLLEDDEQPLKVLKEARLLQINAYIHALPAMQEKYSRAISVMMQASANLNTPTGLRTRTSVVCWSLLWMRQHKLRCALVLMG